MDSFLNELHKKTQTIAEQYYGTAHDPNQIPINGESQKKLFQLHPHTVRFKLIDNEPVSWIVVVPATKELAEKFVTGEITERELFDKTVPSDRYEALYFCSVFTVRDYQRKGYATALLKEAVTKIPLAKHPYLFSWAYSPAGAKLHHALTEKFKTVVHLRKSK